MNDIKEDLRQKRAVVCHKSTSDKSALAKMCARDGRTLTKCALAKMCARDGRTLTKCALAKMCARDEEP